MKDADLCSYGCFAHSLQLVVNDGVLCQRAVVDLLAVCRSIVGHFRRSTVAYDKLRKIQQQLHVPEHNLKQDEPTRWNSSFYMLKSIVEQKMSLAAYGSDGSIPVLTSAQLDLANKVIEILLPVEEITRTISEEKACISAIIPMVRVLKKTLEQPGEDRGVHSMKSAMLDSLQKRFSDIEQTDFLVLSTLLDPRYKDKFFSSVNSRACAKDLLEDVHRFQDCEINLQEPAPK